MRLSEQLVVECKDGLHARPAAELARIAKAFQSEITLCCNGLSANAKSMLSLMLLAATKGTELTVTAEGADAADALLAITRTEHFAEANTSCRSALDPKLP